MVYTPLHPLWISGCVCMIDYPLVNDPSTVVSVRKVITKEEFVKWKKDGMLEHVVIYEVIDNPKDKHIDSRCAKCVWSYFVDSL